MPKAVCSSLKALGLFIKRNLHVLLAPLLISLNTHGAIVTGLNEAAIVVSDQSQRTQRAAMQQALQDVLVKISGSDALLQSQQIRNGVRQANSLLSSFRFENVGGELVYRATFNQQRVEEMIKSAGYPIWGVRRPDSLIWFAFEQPNTFQRQLVSEYNDSDYKQYLLAAAEQRAIPVGIPLMDLDDLQQITTYDVWGRFVERIEAASQRYQADYVLAARMFDRNNIASNTTSQSSTSRTVSSQRSAFSEDEFQSLTSGGEPIAIEWVLLANNDISFGQLSATTHRQAIVDFIDMLADTLSSRYAIDTENLLLSRNQIDITIMNVESLDQYVAISRFLDSLTIVDNATLRAQSGQQATFTLDMIGSQNDLLSALRLDKKLQILRDEFGQARSDLKFYWVP